MSYCIKYTNEAKIDLKEIKEYISDYSNSVSNKFINFLTNKLQNELSFTPYMYRKYFDGEDIRFIPHKGYIIFYRILEEKKIVEIITVVYGARDLNNLNIRKK